MIMTARDRVEKALIYVAVGLFVLSMMLTFIALR